MMGEGRRYALRSMGEAGEVGDVPLGAWARRATCPQEHVLRLYGVHCGLIAPIRPNPL